MHEPSSPFPASAALRFDSVPRSLTYLALFGLAVGTHHGGRSLAQDSLALPAGVAIAGLVAVPALLIALGLIDSHLRLHDVAQATTDGLMAMAAVLAGLAPLCAFFAVTSLGETTVSVITVLAMAFAGAFGLRSAHTRLRTAQAGSRESSRAAALSLCGLAGLLAAFFAGRVWLSTLSVFGGAQ